MKLRFFDQKSKRRLLNGAQETVEITTKTHDVQAPLWIAETYKLARHLSDGDRSVTSSTHQALVRGDSPTLMTAEGSVTQELWARLTEFGYMLDLPRQAPSPTTKAWQVVREEHQSWLLFLLAAMVDTQTDPVLIPISKGLSKSRELFMTTPAELLRMLRDGTMKANTPFADGTIEGGLFDVFKRLNLARIEGPQWVATPEGSLVLPFFIDHILFLKGEDQYEAHHDH